MADTEERVPLRNTPSDDLHDDVEGQRRCPRKGPRIVAKRILDQTLRALIWRDEIFVVLCVVAVLVDPLFLYIPVTNENSKCLGVDKGLRTVVLVLRSLLDIIFITHIIRQIRNHSELIVVSDEAPEGQRSSGWTRGSLLTIIVDFLAVLPIPQLAIVVVFFRTKDKGYFLRREILSVFLLFQYGPNVYRLNQSFKKLQLKARLVKGQVNFSRKFFFSFWWGIRNLSNFGTNLETSSYVWENCFAILISVIGLLLFLYLIGIMQIYMQIAAAKAEKNKDDKLTQKIKMKEKGIVDWVSNNGLPPDLKTEIMDFIKQNKVVEKLYQKKNKAVEENMTAEVDAEFLLSVLPENIQTSIKRHVGMNVLNKVQRLHHMDKKVLEMICDHLKPIIYPINSYVLRRGKAIDLMLFITDTEGTMLTYEDPKTEIKRLKKDDIFGEEILSWVSPSISFANLPTPNSTLNVKCETKVEAFAFMAKDLRSVVSGCRHLWNWTLYNCDIESQEFEELARPIDKTHQTYIQLWEEELKSVQKIKIVKDIREWVLRNGLPEDLQTEIMEKIETSKVVKENIGAGVDVNFLFSVLPKGMIKRAIKDHVGVNALKKVPMLQNKLDSTLKSICKYLKPVIYAENSYITRAGKPLNLMLFIIDGIITWTANTTTDTATAGSSMVTELSCLEKGGLYGEELLSWVSPSSSLSTLPISAQDVKCQTKVEAFVINAVQLKIAVSELGMLWKNYYTSTNSQLTLPSDQTYLQIQNETYLQLGGTRLEEIEDEGSRQKMKIMMKEKDILEWLSRNGTHEDLKTKIMRHINLKNIAEQNMDADVDLGYLNAHLPFDLTISLTKHLCISTLKQMAMLQSMHEDMFSNICYKLEPVIYTENSNIVQAGESLDLMLIIIGGTIICTDMTSNTETTDSAVITKYLNKGDFCGEELLAWASPSILFSSPAPISTRDVKCQSKVEAFILKADKLRSLVSEYSSEWISNFNNCNNSEQIEELARRRDKMDQILNETYMKFGTTELEEIEDEELKQKVKIMIKEKDILAWVSRNVLDEDLKSKIMTHLKLNNVIQENLDAKVDVEYLHSHLPFGIAISLTKHICISMLKNVPMLENMPEDMFSNICYKLEPVIYTESSNIVQAGEQLDLMLIITEGTSICTDVTSNTGTTDSSVVTKYLKKGDFCGEELLCWASPNILFSGAAPISTRDVKCQTKVEAFVLKVDKLRSLVSEYSSKWISNFNNSCDNSKQLEESALQPDKIDQILNETYKKLGTTKLEEIEDEGLRQTVKIMIKEKDILEWVSRNGVQEDLKTKIMMHLKLNNVIQENLDAEVDVEYLYSHLPFGIAISLTKHICISMLKKVPMLQSMPEDMFSNICYKLEPMIYFENSNVVQAGESLDLMLIIIEGTIICTKYLDQGNTGTTDSGVITKYLKKGDFCGEELLSWASPNILFSGPAPLSTGEVKCQTKVEAFVLKADKLRSLVSEYSSKWISNFNNSAVGGG
ncbi:hypothetical protein L3X38_022379 [Prunus dulcis]|uniref:Cyclic nucleotide-binding domain-containing protein n=1 Tax=Prunus dulcis TaxID=3755 RepID=A0AAD4VVW0_PRUDU|nr:hypothetical protein L3X38_022379 [Prunus dulcis]